MGDNLYDLFMVRENEQWKLWTCTVVYDIFMVHVIWAKSDQMVKDEFPPNINCSS